MDCLISINLKEAGFQTPQYIERVKPEMSADSGFRIYLGYERTSNPKMCALGDCEQYLRDVGLYDLVHDIDVGERVDMSASINDYPHIHYGPHTLKFTTKGLVPLNPGQESISGMVETEDGKYMIPFKSMTLEERRSIKWSDRLLIKKKRGI